MEFHYQIESSRGRTHKILQGMPKALHIAGELGFLPCLFSLSDSQIFLLSDLNFFLWNLRFFMSIILHSKKNLPESWKEWGGTIYHMISL